MCQSFPKIEWSWLGTAATVSIIFFEAGHEDIERHSKILKIPKKDDQDNEDTIF